MNRAGEGWLLLLTVVITAGVIPCMGARIGAHFNFEVSVTVPEGVRECTQSLQKIPNCVAETVTSILGLSRPYECCIALQGIREHCLLYLTSILPFNHLFPPIQEFCTSSPRSATSLPQTVAVKGSTTPPASHGVKQSLPVGEPLPQ